MNLIELAISYRWEISNRQLSEGDIIRIINKSGIFCGDDLTNGKEYVIKAGPNLVYIIDDVGDMLSMSGLVDWPHYESLVRETN